MAIHFVERTLWSANTFQSQEQLFRLRRKYTENIKTKHNSVFLTWQHKRQKNWAFHIRCAGLKVILCASLCVKSSSLHNHKRYSICFFMYKKVLYNHKGYSTCAVMCKKFYITIKDIPFVSLCIKKFYITIKDIPFASLCIKSSI